jgi:hypothetical protein
MPDSRLRRIQKHPWAGKDHHLANTLTHFFFIAMHSAVAAKGLFLHKGAFSDFPF